MKRVILLALALTCLLTFTISPTLAQDPNYVLVWSDEFDTDGAPDPAKWYHQTQFPVGDSWFNGELQHYTDEAANSFVESGVLKIVAKKETYMDQGVTKDYTSARLNSKYAFTFGRVEVRAKLPAGAGTWPAIWTLGKNINEDGGFWDATYGTTAWPACGEIDIMEHWGSNQNVVQSAMHTPSSFGGTINKGDQTIATATTDFHVYGMEWTADKIVFDVDGVEHYTYEPATQDADTWPFDADQYILLNTAIEGNIGTVNPTFTEATMEIDYVRVYEDANLLSGSEVLAEGFDASTSVDDWTLAGDAAGNPTEVTLVWNETGGVDGGGAMDFTAANSDGVNGRSFILQKSFTGLDFSSASEIDISLDIKGDITDANVNLLVQVLGTGGQLDQRSIQSEINNSTFSSVTYTLSGIPSGLTEFFVQFNIATGPVIGQGGNLIIDNITVTPSGGGGGGTDPVLPTAGPVAPTEDSGDVISIYSDSYTDVSNSGFSNYGAATFEQVDLGGNNALRYTLAGVDGGNFQVIELGGANQIDASGAGMTNFRFDAWFPEAVDGSTSLLVKVVDISGSTTEAALTISTSSTPAMAQGEWLSYDFSLADLGSAGIGGTSNIQQVVIDVANTPDVYLDNIYFYDDGNGGGGVTPSTDVLAESFDASTSVDDWTLAGDAAGNPTEVTLVWNETGGVDGGGAMDFTAANSDGVNGRSFILQKSFTGLDFSSASEIDISLDIKGDITDANVNLLVQVLGTGGQLDQRSIQSEINNSTFSSVTYTLSGIPSGLTEFFVQFNIATGPVIGQGGNLIIDNITVTPSDGGGGGTDPVLPTAGPVAPTEDSGDVISIYSDSYTDVSNSGFSNYGAATFEQVDLGGNNALRYTLAGVDGGNFQVIELGGANQIDASGAGMTNFRFDVWFPEAVDGSTSLLVKVVDISGSTTEAALTISTSSTPAMAQGEWLSYDFSLADLGSAGIGGTSNIQQVVIDVANTPDVYLDNIYFYDAAGSGGGGGGTDPILPTAGPVAPTEDAADVISIYSDSYTDVSNSGFSNYGAATFEQVDLGGNNALRYTLAGVDGGNFQVIELSGANQIDASGAGMTNFRFDAWFPEAVDGSTSLLVKVVDISGSTTEAALTISTSSTPAMAQGEWLSYDFSLADLGSAGIGGTSNIQQVVIDVANTPDVYLDNIYFYDDGNGGGGVTPSTDVLAEGFDASTSIDGWTLAGDAATNPSEVTLAWNETGGVEGGAMDFSAANSDGVNGRAFIVQKTFTGLDFSNASDVDITLDIKGDITDANVNLLVQVLGAGGQLDQRSIQSEINSSTFSAVSYSLTGIPSGLTEFLVQFNVATGDVQGQGGSLTIDNIIVSPSGSGGGGGETCVAETEQNIDPALGSINWTFKDGESPFDAFGNIGGAIVDNPYVDMDNESCKVYKIDKTTGCEGFAGIGLELPNAIDFNNSTDKEVRLKVYAETEATSITVQLERLPFPDISPEVAITQNISAIGQWEELVFDFSGHDDKTFKSFIIYTNRGETCDGDVYYVDDIKVQLEPSGGGGGGGGSIELPITFEDDIDYEFNDFEGAATVIVEDPEDATNKVAQSTRGTVDTPSGGVAGTTVANTSGFGAIPFTAESTTMSVTVRSPVAGIPVRLKVEDKGNTGISVETEATVTEANTWETIVFDFSNEVSGTAALNIANTYDKATIFFDFGTAGNGEAYYWDDVVFGGDSGGGNGGGGSGQEDDYCEQAVFNNGDSGQADSEAILTIENSGENSMKVTITSANEDPVDLLIVNRNGGAITGAPAVSEADDSVPGELSVTLTWTDTPPTDVEMNVLWSKASFEGNWQLGTENITVPFNNSCDGGSGGGDPVGLPVDFESSTLTYTFDDFEGGGTTVIDNPQSNGINTSSKVAQTVKGAGQVFAGTTLQLDEPIDFDGLTAIKVKVYSPRADVPLTFKLESSSGDGNDTERIVAPTAANTWEELEFDFADNIRNDYTGITLIWDNGTAGDGSADWTFLVDDIVVAEGSAPGTDASLSALLVDDVSVNRFDSETFEYFVLLPEGTATDAIPTVTATTTDAAATFEVTNPTELPGSASVLVTAEDGTTTSTYSIEYKIDENLSKVATLSDLQVGGTSIESFDPEVFEYSIELAETVTTAPEVIGTATDANASILVQDAISLPGTTKVIVTAEDGVTVRNYSIDFTYPEGTEVTFAVAGTVTADGASFSSGTVVIYETDNITNAKTASLGEDGTYSITSLTEGSYYVYIDSDSEDFVTTFYGNVSSVVDANAVPLTLVMDRNRVADVAMVAKPVSAVEMLGEDEGATIGFQAQSVSGGSGSRIVSGRVSQGEGLANVLVILNTADDEYVTDGVTDSDGFVTFTGIPTGDYKLIVDVPGVGRVSSEISAVEGQESEFTGLIDESGIFINQVLGLEEELLQDMKVYPNPTVDRLSIEVPNGLIVRDYSLTVISLSGQTFIVPSTIRERSIDIDVRQLESGVYIIRLITEAGTADKRFIKQ